jgi:fermentation-respiration switch protein FrsA (DUF1100 family)
MFFPDQYPVGRWDPQQFMIVPSEHTFPASDGTRLHGWLFEAQTGTPASSPALPPPVLIWFHGNAGNLTDRADMCVEHAKRGTSVFVFDYRGFGRSEGKASETKLYRDALAAYDYIARRKPRDIYLYGESIGGPYAAYVAKERKGVRGVILENTFPSLLAMGNALYHPIPLGWTAPFAMQTTRWLNEAGVPVLVMHGKRDEVIPYALGQQLYDELSVPKELLTSHAGHCEIPLFDAQRYYEAVDRFVK